MHQFWKNILKDGSDLLPDFNDDLLLNFRKRKIREIVTYIDTMFKWIESIFNSKIEYVGHRDMTPQEIVDYTKTNPILKKKVKIQDSSFYMVRFEFRFEGVIYPVIINVPYLVEHAVIFQGTKYYPIFPIIERGGLNRQRDNVLVKVLCAPLNFWRNEIGEFETTRQDKLYRAIVVTCRLHQKIRSTGKRFAVPIILYSLCKFQFKDVLRRYGFADGEFELTHRVPEEEGYSLIPIQQDGDLCIRVPDAVLEDKYKTRFIASYIKILQHYPRYELRDLEARDMHYYITALGKYTYPDSNNGAMMHCNALKHLESTDFYLDLPARYQLSQIGIQVENLYELIEKIFFNIDEWLVGYDPNDQFNKKIGSLDQMLADVIRRVNLKMFDIINDKKQGLTCKTVSSFTNSVSRSPDWITKTTVFRANPSIYNDNWLLAIGAQRFRSLENTEVKQDKKKSGKLPTKLLKAHPSQLVVESILYLPPSNPIASGAINPFLQIDEDGNFIVPEWYDRVKHVFD